MNYDFGTKLNKTVHTKNIINQKLKVTYINKQSIYGHLFIYGQNDQQHVDKIVVELLSLVLKLLSIYNHYRHCVLTFLICFNILFVKVLKIYCFKTIELK